MDRSTFFTQSGAPSMDAGLSPVAQNRTKIIAHARTRITVALAEFFLAHA